MKKEFKYLYRNLGIASLIEKVAHAEATCGYIIWARDLWQFFFSGAKRADVCLFRAILKAVTGCSWFL